MLTIQCRKNSHPSKRCGQKILFYTVSECWDTVEKGGIWQYGCSPQNTYMHLSLTVYRIWFSACISHFNCILIGLWILTCVQTSTWRSAWPCLSWAGLPTLAQFNHYWTKMDWFNCLNCLSKMHFLWFVDFFHCPNINLGNCPILPDPARPCPACPKRLNPAQY